METDVLVLYKNEQGTAFFAYSQNGFSWYYIMHKNTTNKNLQRLVNYMFASIKVGGQNNTLVFNLRPIFFLIKNIKDELVWKNSFQLLASGLKNSKNYFRIIIEFIEYIKNFPLNNYLFQLFAYLLVFHDQNIVLNVNQCFYCQRTFDLYCLALNLGSVVCKSCYNKKQHLLTRIIKNIDVLKTNDYLINSVGINWMKITDIKWNEKLLREVIFLYQEVHSFSFS